MRLEGADFLQSKQRRSADMLIAGVALIPAGAVGVAAAVALGIEMRRSPLFMQARVAGEHSLFNMPKLVTMHGAIEDGVSEHGYDHPRASMIGHYVRKLHVDETPQLMSVLKGDMSIVGPRPRVQAEHEATMDVLNSKEQADYLHSLHISPGGIAHLGGERQHLGQPNDLYANAQHTIEWAHNASLRLYFNVLARNACAATMDILPGKSVQTTADDGTIAA